MGITSEFDGERKVIVMKIFGKITVSELVGGYDSIFSDDQFRPNMHAIWDMSGLDLKSIPISEVRQLLLEMRKYMDQRGDDYKAALVTTRKVDFQLLRLYVTILKLIGSNIRIRLCRSMTEAYEWVDD